MDQCVTRCVIHFEDIPEVVQKFYDVHLAPALTHKDKSSSTVVKFASYWEDRALRKTLPARVVAQQAVGVYNEYPRLARVAFLVDLHAGTGTTSSVKYGVDVIRELAVLLTAGDAQRFLTNENFLTCIFSIHTGGVNSVMSAQWPQSRSCTLSEICNRQPCARVPDALSIANSGKPRIVIAERVRDAHWLADLVAAWL